MEQQVETYLYKVEAVLSDAKLYTVIVAAVTEAKAFEYAENHLLRHTITPPQIKELSVVEKKPIGRGGIGYVIETSSF